MCHVRTPWIGSQQVLLLCSFVQTAAGVTPSRNRDASSQWLMGARLSSDPGPTGSAPDSERSGAVGDDRKTNGCNQCAQKNPVAIKGIRGWLT